MSILARFGITGLGSAAKRIGQSATVLYSVFFGPMMVPVQLTVWPRMVIAVAIVIALPLLNAMRGDVTRRIWISVAAVAAIAVGGWCGFDYWASLPAMTISVRSSDFVRGTTTADTRKELERNGLRDDASDLKKLIEGQQNKTVEDFFDPDSVAHNKTFLAVRYIAFLAAVSIGIVILLEWLPDGAEH